jgi:hypothetical protein
MKTLYKKTLYFLMLNFLIMTSSSLPADTDATTSKVDIQPVKINFESANGWALAAHTRLVCKSYGLFLEILANLSNITLEQMKENIKKHDFSEEDEKCLGLENSHGEEAVDLQWLDEVDEIRLGVSESKTGFVDGVEITCADRNAVFLSLLEPFNFNTAEINSNEEKGYAYGASVSLPLQEALAGCKIKDIRLMGLTTEGTERARVDILVREKA